MIGPLRLAPIVLCSCKGEVPLADTTKHFTAYSDAEWDVLTERARWIAPIAALPPGRRAELIDAASRHLGCCRATIYSWVNKYVEGERVSSLAPRRPGVSKGHLKLDPRAEAIIGRQIQKIYLKKNQKVRVSELVKAVKAQCREDGLKPASRSTVERRLNLLDRRSIAKRRGELDKAERLEVLAGSHEVLLPNEEWQIDHSPADVILVSAEGNVVGRPWITFIIDVATRMIVGFLVTFDPPQATTVARTLAFAVGPKAEYLKSLGLSGVWPCAGKPLSLFTDGASEFARSAAYRRGCSEHLIDFRTRPVGEPWYGGHIERLIGTVVGKMRMLPGATFSNPIERGRYDSAKSASLTIGEFTRWLVEQILEYHDTRHRSLGCTPLQAWTQKSIDYGFSPQYPPHLDTFFRDFLPSRCACIGRQGISIKTFEYSAPILRELKARGHKRVQTWFDPNDLSAVFIRDGEGRSVPLKIRYPGVPPFALWEVVAEQRRRRESDLEPVAGLPLVDAVLAARGQVRVRGTTMTQNRRRERLREHGLIQTPGTLVSESHLKRWADILEGGLDV